MPFTLTVRTAAEAEAARLAARRVRMRAYRRAFKVGLDSLPATGSLAATYPSATTMLEIVEQHLSSGNAPRALRRALEDIVIFLRTHSDVEAFRNHFGLTHEQMDAVFDAAETYAESE